MSTLTRIKPAKVLVAGDKGRAICERCSAVVDTVLARRDVAFSDGLGMARGILAGVCGQCGAIVSIPAQSTPEIAAARVAQATSKSDSQ